MRIVLTKNEPELEMRIRVSQDGDVVCVHANDWHLGNFENESGKLVFRLDSSIEDSRIATDAKGQLTVVAQ